MIDRLANALRKLEVPSSDGQRLAYTALVPNMRIVSRCDSWTMKIGRNCPVTDRKIFSNNLSIGDCPAGDQNSTHKHMMAEGGNPSVGLLLCTQKDHVLVEYTLAGIDNRLFVSKYQFELSRKEDLQRFGDEKHKAMGWSE